MESYFTKRFLFKGQKVTILIQNKNGPCPLIALANTLLLQKRLTINWNKSEISNQNLLQMIANQLLQSSSATRRDANFQKVFQDGIQALPSFTQGLDINVQFTSTNSFQYTHKQDIFNLLGVNLVHGWIYPPDSQQEMAIGKKSYNQLQDMLIQCQELKQQEFFQEKDLEFLTKGSIVSSFLRETASQLTYQGLLSLHQDIQEGKIAVFFRNNHFSCIVKEQGQIYQLVTDIGFKNRPTVVWEKLESIDGNNSFCDSSFKVTYSQFQPPKIYNPIQRSDESSILLALNLQFQQKKKQTNKIVSQQRRTYQPRPPRPKHLPREKPKPKLILVPQPDFKEHKCIIM